MDTEVKDHLISLGLLMLGTFGVGISLVFAFTWPDWWAVAPGILGSLSGLVLIALRVWWCIRNETRGPNR